MDEATLALWLEAFDAAELGEMDRLRDVMTFLTVTAGISLDVIWSNIDIVMGDDGCRFLRNWFAMEGASHYGQA